LHVVHVLEATTGGTRRHLVDLTLNLDKTKFNVRVICSLLRQASFQSDVEKLRAAGIRVDVIPMTRRVHPLHDAAALVRIVRNFRQTPCDIVHCHSAKAGFLGRIAARLVGARAIYTPHCFPFLMDVHPLQRLLYLALEKFAARLTHHFIAVSESERNTALQARLCAAERVTVVRNGIDATRNTQHATRNTQHVLTIGTVGRLTKQKGQSDLLLAAQQVVKEFPQAKFILVGGGEDESHLRNLTATLGLDQHVEFLGEREDVERIYPTFDVYVLPSLWEALPYTPLEAMAASKPVVATDVGGVSEIVVDGETGCLIPPHQPMTLAENVCALLRQPSLRQAMGTRGRQRVERMFTLEQMVRETERIYESVGEEVSSDQ
jgi:glycosyltransferase involved in cell wall biosynthesis